MERANAAQMAARTIKQTKKGGRQGSRTPLRNDQSAPQLSQGGGLFGGSLQASGGFNFSAPGGLSFPPAPSFGGGNVNNSFGMNNGSSPELSDNDERRDPGEERASKKPFRGPASGLSAPQQSNSVFETSNIFGQPQQSNPFGSTDTLQQNGGFLFGSTTPTPINFNADADKPADKPANKPFSFPATAPQPPAPSPGFNIGQTVQIPAQVVSSEFGFGSSASAQAPIIAPSTGFGFGSSSQAPSPAPNNGFNFGSSKPAEKPSGNLFSFGQTPSQPISSAVNFGGILATDAPSTNIFGTSQPPSTNIFGSTTQSPAQSNIFSGLNAPAVSASTLFGNQGSPSGPNLFGGQSQQSAQSTSNPFGSSQTSPSSNLFGEPKSQSSSNMFGIPSSTPSTKTLLNKPTEQPTPTSMLFGSVFKPMTVTNELFGTLNKPVDQSIAKPKIDGTKPPETSSLYSEPALSTTPFGGSQSLFTGQPPSQPESSSPKSIFPFGSAQTSFPEANMSNNMFTPIKSMDAPTTASQPPLTGMFPSLQQPSPQKPKEVSKPAANFPPPKADPAAVNILMGGDPPKEGTNNGSNFANLALAKQITEEIMNDLIPASFTDDQRKDFYAAYRMRALNKAMEHYFGSLKITGDPTAALKFYNEQRSIIMEGVVIRKSTKRKAKDEETQDDTPNKRAKQAELPSSIQLPPQPPRSTSPAKASQIANEPQQNLNGSTTPQAPTLAPPSFTPVAPFTSPSPSGKRKATDDLNQDTNLNAERPLRKIKTPKLNVSSGGSETSNIFKNILDSPSEASPTKSSPLKKTAVLPVPSKVNIPTANPFGNLPGVSVMMAAPSPIFLAPKPSTAPTTIIGKPRAPTFGPTFGGGGPVNFLEQFGQQAKMDEEDSEKKLMEHDKAEDMDSDDDEDEWEANWKATRRAKLKELKAKSMSGSGFIFAPTKKTSETPAKQLFDTTPTSGNGSLSPLNVSRKSTPGQVSSALGSVFDGHAPGRPVTSLGGNIFGHLSDSGVDSGKSDDADNESEDEDTDADVDSENKDPSYKPNQETGSGHGTPSTPVEETGAGISSAKKNPFGFGTSTSGGLFGATITGSSNLGTSTPGSLFDRISKDSSGNPIRQISTEEKENNEPRTSNFWGDAKNPFSSLNKPQAPADQTWKPDSPIRFSSANLDDGKDYYAPTVSVTAATPTKSGSPSNITGALNTSGSTTSMPLASLFGNSSTTKPTAPTSVGFSFGSSNASSLFPSATTSRATSPGATTDGDNSAAETDPDAERHEQIDLTAGGPGEEDEEVVYEVRVKALKFCHKGDGDESISSWDIKGVGPLRVLKHKGNGTARILMRSDPRGTIVLNKGILPQVTYEATGKTLKLLTAGDGGKNLETWILQMKTQEFSEKLAEILEALKPSS